MSDDAVLTALARLEARMDEGFTTLEARLRDELTRLRVDVMDRFERVENNLAEIRDDINVTIHCADRADDNALHARDELRAMWRMIPEAADPGRGARTKAVTSRGAGQCARKGRKRTC